MKIMNYYITDLESLESIVFLKLFCDTEEKLELSATAFGY